MYDNGLLKYYRQNNNRNGYLETSSIEFKEILERLNRRITKYRLPEGVFYSKSILMSQSTKKITDAEVLLSQIYNKAGLVSAVSLPAEIDGTKVIISNDIETPTTIQAYDCFRKLESETKTLLPVDFLNARYSGDIASRFFTERGLEQQIKMRILDTASFINERLTGDFFFIAKGDKIDGVSCIDFEESGQLCPEKEIGEDGYFESDFSNEFLTREELLNLYKTSPVIERFVDKTELANTIGLLDPQGIAQDIKATIGYEIDPKYTSVLASSYDEMAETLIQ